MKYIEINQLCLVEWIRPNYVDQLNVDGISNCNQVYKKTTTNDVIIYQQKTRVYTCNYFKSYCKTVTDV